MKNAPREMKAYVDNLRSELQGERDYFRKAMKQVRSRSRSNPRDHVDCAPLKLLNDSARHLMQDFRRLERPFLDAPQDEEDHDVEKSEEPPYRPKYVCTFQSLSLDVRTALLSIRPCLGKPRESELPSMLHVENITQLSLADPRKFAGTDGL